MSRYWTYALTALATMVGPAARAGDVSGRVEMPATCSPGVSPAVVHLERLDGKAEPAEGRGAEVALTVNQKGLQFEPRVQAIRLGQIVKFTNADDETHNVHLLTPGTPFNQSMGRGASADYKADRPGLLRVVCDVHSHMRGFVVVSPTPHFAVCRPDGRFRLDAVPAGRYRLVAWHEMGQGATREVEVKGDEAVVVPAIPVEAPAPAVAGAPAPIRPWADVTDRVGLLLAEARGVVSRPGGVAKARKLAESAYFEEFEASDMETAVRRHLGYRRAGAIEGQFRTIWALTREVAAKKATVATLADRSRELLLTLVAASGELNRLGVTDRSNVESGRGVASEAPAASAGEIEARQAALATALDGVARLADAGEASDASSSMATAYFDAFEPLERALAGTRPQEIRPLEARFNATRGKIGQGLKGEALAAELASLRSEVAAALGRAQAAGTGTFGPAFFASLVTILREGVEVILLLTMLIALVIKTGQPRALAAIRWGVASAAGASLATAVGLNLLVATAQGRTREQIEGWVLMLAAGVLFYVSYWLISQSESKRWTSFLKEQVGRGVAGGGFATLGLTAFLAVYREGAETALMYQAMIAGQAGSRSGLLGLAVGLGVGLLGLAVIYRVIRSTSVRLPLRSFFQVTGVVLFAMAVVFAGNGVAELQSAGLLKITPVGWLGAGLPWLGLHPNVQVVTVQGLLLAGAAVSFLLLATDRARASIAKSVARSVEPAREGMAV